MIRSFFECTFLTDVVINATAATEGNNSSLDYIPGSGFLGIAARSYNDFGEDAYVVFHSGKVRFGDAHIVLNGQRSLKVPASFFIAKGTSMSNNQEIYVHHTAGARLKDELRMSGIQIKQQRKDYIAVSEEGCIVVSPSKDYALKSAYDRKSRKSEDAKMFGYEWLKSGSNWRFSIDIDTDSTYLSQKITESLIGEKQLGRSKTAQFGLVSICHLEDQTIEDIKLSGLDEIILYCETCLAFVNQFGLPTFLPKASDFGIEGNIVWEKCQILTRNYSPWNQKRFTREADRICIDKGSVIVIKPNETADLSIIQKAVGLYRNEGFGHLLVNPSFLKSDSEGRLLLRIIEDKPEVKNGIKSTNEFILPVIPDELKQNSLMQFIHNTAQNEQLDYKILAEVQIFMHENETNFKRIKASQWGGIRDRATRAITHSELMRLLFGVSSDGGRNDEEGYLTHGVAAIEWGERNRRELLKHWIEKKKDEDSRTATLVLAAAMAKKCNTTNK